MYKVGEFNLLRVKKESEFGLFLDGVEQEILMPKRFVPEGAKRGDELRVFIYHDSENRLTATNQEPYGVVGDIVNLKCTDVTVQGAFLDWGLMKDLFVPASKQMTKMVKGQDYLVKIFIDEMTGRAAATEKLDPFLSNEELTVNEKDIVDLIVYRRTDLGFVVIINQKHTGLLHYNDVFGTLDIGDKLKGFIKNIKEENKIDIGVGEIGYKRVENESEKILRLLQENDGYLPYHDKSDPQEIYDFFSMSKKVFKMTTGSLYKARKIEFTKTGIKLIEE